MIYIRYLFKLLGHKWRVWRLCCLMGYPLAGLNHDSWKFLPRTFISHAKVFAGNAPIETVDRWWAHHLRRSRHHWQYWYTPADNGEVLIEAMPTRYIVEMIADWIDRASSRDGVNLQAWVDSTDMHFHPDTLVKVRGVLALVGVKIG